MKKIADLIKELRLKTRAGFLDCKKALIESKYNIEHAIIWLKEKNKISALNKRKETRELNEGIVDVNVLNNKAVIFKLACETDFVAQNKDFVNFTQTLLNSVLNSSITNKDLENNLQAILDLKSSNNETIQEKIDALISQYKEKIVLEKVSIFNKQDQESFGYYSHNDLKTAALIKFEKNIDPQLGKQFAMHVVAMKPTYLNKDQVEKKDLDIERKILAKKLKSLNKPEFIKEKIIQGKLEKYYSNVCLLNQSFIFELKKSVLDVLKETNNNIINFKLYQI